MLRFELLEESALSALSQAMHHYASGDEAKAASFFIFGYERPSMQIANGRARIAVHRVLEQDRGFFTGTSYTEIRQEVTQALENDSVTEIVLDIASPGGSVSGIVELAAFLRESREQKRIVAEISGTACSAAYWIAAQANEIIALSPINVVGSIGCLIGPMYTDVDYIAARSKNAPLKGRQFNEPEGIEAVQPYLDDVHLAFIENIISGRGRGLTEEKINSDFGRGGVMTARQALAAGMIDGITQGNIVGDDMADATIVTPKSSPEFIDRPWRASEADARVRDHTGSNDSPNNSGDIDRRYSSYFSWFDADASENFGSYKLPIADVDGGSLVYNVRAVRNALARLDQVDGPSQSDKDKIRQNLERLLEDSKTDAKGSIMNIDDLKAQHPDVYAQVVALGREEGVKAERDRVSAHMTMGKTSGDMEAAAKFIAEGNDMTEQAVTAHYMAAGMKNNERTAAQEDSAPDLGTDEPKDDKGEQVKSMASAIVANLN